MSKPCEHIDPVPALCVRRYRIKEEGVRCGFMVCAFLSIVTTVGIIAVLCRETFAFFQRVGLWEFFTGTVWTPLFEPAHFGLLPLVCGTLLVTVGAGLIAIPVGLGIAVFLSEYASPALRNLLKPVLEILAGIPTVVYGYFALVVVTPLLQIVFPSTQVFNAASASIVVAIMILPMVASLCDDALRAVPEHLRHAGFALGATKYEVITRVVVPGAFSGVLAASVLALYRALGETMAVAIAAGSTPVLTVNPLESIQTMTAYIVQVSLGDTPAGTVEYQSLFAVGAVLFAGTLFMNTIAQKVLRRFREVYE